MVSCFLLTNRAVTVVPSLVSCALQLYAEKVANRGLSAVAQCESLRFKLLGGLAVRRACYGVVRFIIENGAKGCEVIVSGKLRAQRAKAMKFVDGFMIHSGQPARDYVDSAVRLCTMEAAHSPLDCSVVQPLPGSVSHRLTNLR